MNVRPKDIAPVSAAGIQGTPKSKLTEAAIEKEVAATATRIWASDMAINTAQLRSKERGDASTTQSVLQDQYHCLQPNLVSCIAPWLERFIETF